MMTIAWTCYIFSVKVVTADDDTKMFQMKVVLGVILSSNTAIQTFFLIHGSKKVKNLSANCFIISLSYWKIDHNCTIFKIAKQK